jgi:hypothetical protein
VHRTGRLFVQLSVVACYNAFSVACAPPTGYRAPEWARAYQIVVKQDDSLSRGIAAGLRRRGFKVRDRVKGGGSPTAYLLLFSLRGAESGAPTWLYAQLADTRSGAVIATVAAPLDSLGGTVTERARAVVDSLVRGPSPRPPN